MSKLQSINITHLNDLQTCICAFKHKKCCQSSCKLKSFQRRVEPWWSCWTTWRQRGLIQWTLSIIDELTVSTLTPGFVSLILSMPSSSTGRGVSSNRIRVAPGPCGPRHRSPSQPPAASRPAAQPTGAERWQRSCQQAGLRPAPSPTSGGKPRRLGSPHRGAHSGPGRSHLPQDLPCSRVQVWLRAVTN